MADDRRPETPVGPDPAGDGPRRRADLTDPIRVAIRLVAVTALVPAVVLGLLALLAGPIVAVIVFVVVAVGISGYVWRTAGSRVRTAIGGRPADPRTDARLLNLVDGLCTAAGLHPPDVRVIDSPGLNAIAAGLRPAEATLAVTSGLLASLSRIELEGVLADELVAIRRNRMVPATVAASVPPVVGRLFGAGRLDEAGADRAAVGLTRYPPGLAGAFGKMAMSSTVVDSRASLLPLWLAEPRSVPSGTPRLALTRRIEALEEL